MSDRHDAWAAGRSYEQYMCRWSRLIAAQFVDWLDPPKGADWVEIGCGTGALTATILARTDPRSVLATDLSDDFVGHASAALRDARLDFATAGAQDLPLANGAADIVTSGLVLNFVPDRPAALAEMQRVLRPDGLLTFYVWDYPGGGMGVIDAFWRAAADCDPAAAALDEATRFPFCTDTALRDLCARARLRDIELAAIEVETSFDDFDAFWHPFTLGAGPAPGYCQSLDETRRAELRRRLAAIVGAEGPVRLPARAWAVRARRSA